MKTAALVLTIALAACSNTTPTPSVAPSSTLTPQSTAAPTATVAGSVAPPAAPTIGPLVEGPLPADVVARLQGELESYVAEIRLVPSISAAVIVPGVGTWTGVAGSADKANETAATPDTVYAVGSVTMTFVAALILRLAEDGYLGLDDPAADHLGPVAGSKTNGATVRQLLGHRSGIDNYTDHFDQSLDRDYALSDLLKLIGEPHFSPGEDFELSNSDYLLLGLIAEVVTGGPLGLLLHEYVFDHFGLSRTYYGASEPAPDPVAHGTVLLEDELRDVYDGSGHLPFESAAHAATSAGSMASTAADLATWTYLLCSGQVLHTDAQAAMLDFSESDGYGLGVMRMALPSAGEVVGHSGSIPGFVSGAFMARDSGVVVVVLTNGESVDFDGVLNRLFTAAQRASD